MKPAPFHYVKPRTVDECIELLARYEDDAKPLAGGQSLVALMNLRLARPEILVDLNYIPDLAYVRETDGWLEVGAMTRHRDLIESSVARRACPLVTAAAEVIGYPAIRNRGTIGGSLAHADPAAELPCIAATLDAELVATGPSGQRAILARDFFVSHFMSALNPTEILTAIRFPVHQPDDSWDFQEFARKSGDFALMAVATDLAITEGRVQRARIGVAGAGQRPLRPLAAEELLVGEYLREAEVNAAGEKVADLVVEMEDGAAVDALQPHLARVLTMRALNGAAKRSENGS